MRSSHDGNHLRIAHILGDRSPTAGISAVGPLCTLLGDLSARNSYTLSRCVIDTNMYHFSLLDVDRGTIVVAVL